jgi:hypothetical protein
VIEVISDEGNRELPTASTNQTKKDESNLVRESLFPRARFDSFFLRFFCVQQLQGLIAASSATVAMSEMMG